MRFPVPFLHLFLGWNEFWCSGRCWSGMVIETLLKSSEERRGCWGKTRGRVRGGYMVLFCSRDVNLGKKITKRHRNRLKKSIFELQCSGKTIFKEIWLKRERKSSLFIYVFYNSVCNLLWGFHLFILYHTPIEWNHRIPWIRGDPQG